MPFPTFSFRSSAMSLPTDAKLPLYDAPVLPQPSPTKLQLAWAFIARPLLAVSLLIFSTYFVLSSLMIFMVFDAYGTEAWTWKSAVMAWSICASFAVVDLALIVVTLKVLWQAMGYGAIVLVLGGVLWTWLFGI